MDALWTITPARFGGMDDRAAVVFFRRLLHAEAFRLGIPVTNVNVPQADNVKDGGVDAQINTALNLPQDGLVASGTTRYQLKTGKSFKPWNDADLTKEVVAKPKSKKKSGSTNLKPSINACLANGGRYVLVTFGHELEGTKRDDATSQLKSIFAQHGFPNAKVETLGQCQLASATELFGGLVASLVPTALGPFRSHREWREYNCELQRPFVERPEQMKRISQLQSALRGDDPRHIRILGDAGIGKTRMVWQATDSDDLEPLVVYGFASQFLSGELLPFLLRTSSLQAILVADDCDEHLRADLVRQVKSQFPRIRLVTLSHTWEKGGTDQNILAIPPLEDSGIQEIIQSYGTPSFEAKRWVPLCSGSPRVAHVIGENLKLNPAKPLVPQSSSDIWNRYVQGTRATNDSFVEHTRLILLRLSLFTRFGFGASVRSEAEAIQSMCQAANPQVTWDRFCDIIADLRNRRILQGEHTLYITPKALQIWLWCDFWDRYSEGFNLSSFVSGLPGELPGWFIDTFKYAHGSGGATRTVERLLGPGGPFEGSPLIETEFGSDFFLALAEAHPNAALQCLERTVGAKTHDELLQFSTGRRNVIFALERIVVWRELFARGAALLLRLASAENESWANNATGVFAELFGPGYGPISPTEASPAERFPILERALRSDESGARCVGLKAAAAALHTGSVSRMIGPEFQGLRPAPKLWVPANSEELQEGYSRVWKLIAEILPSLPPDERAVALDTLVTASLGLIARDVLASTCIDTIRMLHENGQLKTKRYIDWLEDLRSDRWDIPAPIREQVSAALETAISGSVASRLRRYVGLRRLDDEYGDGGQRKVEIEVILDELADTLLRDQRTVTVELPWLTSIDAERAHEFGFKLAEHDRSRSCIGAIRDHYRKERSDLSVSLVAGYLACIHKVQPERWEEELDIWAADDALARHVVELTWRSGMSPQAASRISRVLRDGRSPLNVLGVFRFGRTIDPVPESVVWEWVDVLLAKGGPNEVRIAVELLYEKYDDAGDSLNLPVERVMRIVTDPRFFADDTDHHHSLAGFLWIKLVGRLVQTSPEVGPTLLDLILTEVAGRGAEFRRRDSDLMKLCRTIIAQDPNRSWQTIKEHLNDEHQLYWILDWLSGGLTDEPKNTVWDLLPLDSVWDWVREGDEYRRHQVARALPKSLSPDSIGEVTRQFLIHFGDEASVRNSLSAHFHSGMWWGNASNHYEAEQNKVLEWRKAEKHPHVQTWLDEQSEQLKHMIEREKIAEERDD